MQASGGGSTLFGALVDQCGLSSLFAKSVVTRACTRAGVNPEQIPRTKLSGLLAEIEVGIQSFLDPDEVTAALERLRAL